MMLFVFHRISWDRVLSLFYIITFQHRPIRISSNLMLTMSCLYFIEYHVGRALSVFQRTPCGQDVLCKSFLNQFVVPDGIWLLAKNLELPLQDRWKKWVWKKFKFFCNGKKIVALSISFYSKNIHISLIWFLRIFGTCTRCMVGKKNGPINSKGFQIMSDWICFFSHSE